MQYSCEKIDVYFQQLMERHLRLCRMDREDRIDISRISQYLSGTALPKTKRKSIFIELSRFLYSWSKQVCFHGAPRDSHVCYYDG